MKFSINWVKQYIPSLETGDINDFTKKLISSGFDIESVENTGAIFKNFVVGEVLEKEKHPDADKLSLCKVDAGTGNILSIVCGAPNVEKGQKVCVALIGAKVPVGDFEIKKSKIRGQLSEGMICSAKELGLSEDHSGIMVLDKDIKIGTPFSEVIGEDDVIIDFGVTANRGDMLSQFGAAREIAAALDKKFIVPDFDKIYSVPNPSEVGSLSDADASKGMTQRVPGNEELNEEKFIVPDFDKMLAKKEVFVEGTGSPIKAFGETGNVGDDSIKVTIENKELCKRFTAKVIKNITVGESPEWLKKKITSIGLRPRNNIVDITNYVMFETGQPMHAFDLDKIRGNEIIIKTAKAGDKFTTLDSKERTLSDSTLMICDKEGYLSIAGIMGGENSEISDATKNVLLEVAYFDSVNIRLSSKKLGVQSDASYRFERGTDMNMVEYASKRAAALIQMIAGGEIGGFTDIYPEKFQPVEVTLDPEYFYELIDISLSEDEIISLLDKIDIKYSGKDGNRLKFSIPEFRRNDIANDYDLVEEVTRLYGFENIKPDNSFKIHSGANTFNDDLFKFEKKIRDFMIGAHYNEIVTSSLLDSKKLQIFGKETLMLSNPGSVEMNSMRTGLEAGILMSIKNNVNQLGRAVSLKFFEMGNIFIKDKTKFTEKSFLGIALFGNYDLNHYSEAARRFDIFDLKGQIDILLKYLNTRNLRVIFKKESNSIEYLSGKEKLGSISILSKAITEEYDIDKLDKVLYAELDVEKLYSSVNNNIKFCEISRFPAVKRDLAFVVEKNVVYKDIEDIILKSAGKLLSDLSVFDIYEDKRLGENKRSIALNLEFSSPEKTLTDSEINSSVEKIVSDLEKNLSVTLRS
ncbi:hypothetical protein BH10BAC5_BH10BAC5_28210 [soil metagenome]